LLDFSPSEWALPPFEDNGSWTWVSKTVLQLYFSVSRKSCLSLSNKRMNN
jgi:hypothetical protein